MIRIWRSWKSAFGEFSKVYEPEKDECYTALDTYTDEELQRIADADFNAVWIHAQINYLVKTEVFPELGEYADMFQDRLNALIQRAKRYGIKVYLYMQIPRGLPQEHILWKHHPECAGMPDTFPDTNGDCLGQLISLHYLRC